MNPDGRRENSWDLGMRTREGHPAAASGVGRSDREGGGEPVLPELAFLTRCRVSQPGVQKKKVSVILAYVAISGR